MEFFDVTPGSWALDLSAWGAAVAAIGTIWRYALWPFFRAVVRLADGVEKLNALIDGDVLDRLDEGSRTFAEHGRRLDDHEGRIGRVERQVGLEREPVSEGSAP